MIQNRDLNPSRNIYYLGAVLLEVMKPFEKSGIDTITLYQKFRERERVSLDMYILSLDWLFILGLVKEIKGHISLCS